MSTLLIRTIDSLDEVRRVEELQKEVWGMQDRDIVPLTEMVAVRDSGGQLIGAFDGEALVGFVYGFVAIEGGRTVHHSHLLAVKPSYRGADVGYRLKLAQRERVLAQGLTRMTWTFDPLQSVNAHFNFGKLGVVCDQYKIDFYGDQSSSFLHRNGTDRLWVTWPLASSRVKERLREPAGVAARGARRPAVGRDRRRWLAGQRGAARGRLGAASPDRDPGRRRLPGAGAAGAGRAMAPGHPGRVRSKRWRPGFLVEDFVRASRGPRAVGVYVLNRERTMGDFDEQAS